MKPSGQRGRGRIKERRRRDERSGVTQMRNVTMVERKKVYRGRVGGRVRLERGCHECTIEGSLGEVQNQCERVGNGIGQGAKWVVDLMDHIILSYIFCM